MVRKKKNRTSLKNGKGIPQPRTLMRVRQNSLVANLDQVHPLDSLAEVFHVKHLPQEAVFSSSVRQHYFSQNSSAPSKKVVRENNVLFWPCWGGKGAGGRRDKKELAKLFLRGAWLCLCTAVWTQDLAADRRHVYSRMQPLPFPWKSPHAWQAVTLGKKKKNQHFLHVQSRSFNKYNLWESSPHTAQIELRKPTSQNDLNTCLPLQGIVFQAAAGSEQSETAPELRAGSLLLVAVHPRGRKTCTFSLQREEDRKMQERRQLCWDTLPDQAIRKQRIGASDFLYMRRKDSLLE